MKIAIVTPLDPRTGISGYSLALATALSKLGENIHIISKDPSVDQISDNKIEFHLPEDYHVDDYDITHFQLANSKMHEFQLHLLNEHQREIKNNSDIVTTVHDARNFDSFDPFCLKCIKFGLNYLKTPLIYPYDVVDRGFQRISKYLIFHNKSAMNEYKTRYRIENNSLRCIPISAYSLEVENREHNVKSNLDENRLLVPGYISPFKGQDILVDAVAKLDQNYKLIFMGKITDEAYGDYLKGKIQENGIEDKVDILGFVTDKQFNEEIERAKIVLIPRLISSWLKERSIYKFRKFFGLNYLISESSSAVLTMALANGKPIICSKNSGFSEYINQERGMFCEDTVESWTVAMEYLLENQDRLDEMSVNSKKFAETDLSPYNIAKMHLNLYKDEPDI